MTKALALALALLGLALHRVAKNNKAPRVTTMRQRENVRVADLFRAERHAAARLSLPHSIGRRKAGWIP